MKNKNTNSQFLCDWLDKFDNDPSKILGHLDNLNDYSIDVDKIKTLNNIYQDPVSFNDLNTNCFRDEYFIMACKKVVEKYISNLIEENQKYGLKSSETLITTIYSIINDKCNKERNILEKEKLDLCHAKNVLKIFNTYNIEKALGNVVENKTSYICSALDLYKGKFKDFEDEVDKGQIKETDKISKVVSVFVSPVSFTTIPTEYFKDLDFVMACKRATLEAACDYIKYHQANDYVADYSWIERACNDFKTKCEKEHKNIILGKLKKDLKNQKNQKVIDVFSKI